MPSAESNLPVAGRRSFATTGFVPKLTGSESTADPATESDPEGLV